MKAPLRLLRGLLRPPLARTLGLGAILLGGILPGPSRADEVDVLVIYTAAARIEMGGAAAVDDTLQDAIDLTNQIMWNSNISHRVRLVHHEEVPYTEASPFAFEYPGSIDNQRLRAEGDGWLDEAHTLRDLHAADVVFLINSGWGGQSWNGSSFASVGAGSLGEYTFAHELGHMFRCAHAIGDTWDGSSPGTLQGAAGLPYSHGWHLWVGDDRFTTVMGYTNAGWKYQSGSTQIPFYSNPSITFRGEPIGHQDDGDNARTIEENGASVAARKSAHPDAPAPTGVQATDFVGPDVTISWNSLGSGFLYRVYRADIAGIDYEPVGFWQTETTFTDDSAEALTEYLYRVRASKVGHFAPGPVSSADAGGRTFHAPHNVRASDGDYSDRVEITWQAVATAGGYHVFRSDTPGGPKTPLGGWQAGTTYTDVPPTVNTSYLYSVKAAGDLAGTGETGYSDENAGFIGIETPDYLASNATRGDGVEVTWDAVPGAPYYQVSRSEAMVGLRTTISNWQTATSFLDTTGEPGRRYVYWVRAATNSAGVDGSPHGEGDWGWRLAEGPTGVQVVYDEPADELVISWDELPGATDYQVHRRTSPTSSSTVIHDWDPGTSATYQPPPGIEYFYFIRGRYDYDGSIVWTVPSANASGVRPLPPPASITASDGAHPDQIVISWSTVPDASYYQVYRSSTWLSPKTPVSPWQTATSFTHVVAPGTGYFYRVRASAHANGDLPSAYSSADYGEAGLVPPTNVQASDGAPDPHIAVTWQRLGGVHYYKVLRATSIDGPKTDLTGWVVQAYQHDDATAAYSQTYYYWVQAANNASGDSASALSESDIGFRSMPAPTGVTATEGLYTSAVSVKWNRVDGATHYMVYRTSSPSGIYLAMTGWQTQPSFLDGSADPGHTYYYRVKAAANVSGLGESSFSAANGGFRKLPAPDPVNASRGTYPGYVRINWPAIPNASHFKVFRGDAPGGPMTALNSWETGTSYLDFTAVDGQLCYYQVQPARSASGYGPGEISDVAEGWITLPVPGQPDVTDAVYQDKVAVSWQPVTDGVYYRVWRKDSPGGTMTPLSGWQTATTYEDFAVDPGHTYYYAVQAANDGQGNGATALGPAYGGSRRLDPPHPVTATDGSDPDKVIIFWPFADGATYYRVYRTPHPGVEQVPITGWERSMIRFEDLSATAGTTYSYTVRCARGKTGYGESGDSSPDLGWKQPPAPTGVDATDGTRLDDVRVTWDASFPGTWYRVSRSDTVNGPRTPLSGWIELTQWNDATATPARTYYYHVACSLASDGAGPGPTGEDTGWRGVPLPTAPTQSGPLHLATGVDLRPTLDWDDCTDADTYRVKLWTDAGPFHVPTDPWDPDPLSDLTGSSFTPSRDLEPNTKYYWQVYSQNSAGEISGPVWEFTTAGILQVLETPGIAVHNGMVTLTWQSTGDMMIEFSETLGPTASWGNHAGPIVGTNSWTGPLPTTQTGFFRLALSP